MCAFVCTKAVSFLPNSLPWCISNILLTSLWNFQKPSKKPLLYLWNSDVKTLNRQQPPYDHEIHLESSFSHEYFLADFSSIHWGRDNAWKIYEKSFSADFQKKYVISNEIHQPKIQKVLILFIRPLKKYPSRGIISLQRVWVCLRLQQSYRHPDTVFDMNKRNDTCTLTDRYVYSW